ncbi:hypothetical protein DNTS_011870, partial [Danionella cerebrum]
FEEEPEVTKSSAYSQNTEVLQAGNRRVLMEASGGRVEAGGGASASDGGEHAAQEEDQPGLEGSCDVCEPDESAPAAWVCASCRLAFCSQHAHTHLQRHTHTLTPFLPRETYCTQSEEEPDLPKHPLQAHKEEEQCRAAPEECHAERPERQSVSVERLKCVHHGQDGSLYCRQDERIICVLCALQGEHREHQIITLREAYHWQRSREAVDLLEHTHQISERIKAKWSSSDVSSEELESFVNDQFDSLKVLVYQEERRILHLLDLKEAIFTSEATEKMTEISVNTLSLQEEMERITLALQQLQQASPPFSPAAACPSPRASRSDSARGNLRQWLMRPSIRISSGPVRVRRGRMWLWFFLLGSGSVDGQVPSVRNWSLPCSATGSFMCSNGQCVSAVLQCDGFTDCSDHSDEESCARGRSKCAPTFFSCASGIHCIIARFQCNGFRDCPDGSDELNCTGHPVLCSSSRFRCTNGRCVDRSFLCNGQNNCRDNSDEQNCISATDSPGQGSVLLEHQLRLYPTITYAVLGSGLVFILVVALLALVLQHQRKRGMYRGSSIYRGSPQRPLLLSQLLMVDQAQVDVGSTQFPSHSEALGTFHSLQVISCSHRSPAEADGLPSYTQAVMDTSRPVWFDLPPPPYPLTDRDPPDYEEPPQTIQNLEDTTLNSERTDPLHLDGTEQPINEEPEQQEEEPTEHFMTPRGSMTVSESNEQVPPESLRPVDGVAHGKRAERIHERHDETPSGCEAVIVTGNIFSPWARGNWEYWSHVVISAAAGGGGVERCVDEGVSRARGVRWRETSGVMWRAPSLLLLSCLLMITRGAETKPPNQSLNHIDQNQFLNQPDQYEKLQDHNQYLWIGDGSSREFEFPQNTLGVVVISSSSGGTAARRGRESLRRTLRVQSLEPDVISILNISRSGASGYVINIRSGLPGTAPLLLQLLDAEPDSEPVLIAERSDYSIKVASLDDGEAGELVHFTENPLLFVLLPLIFVNKCAFGCKVEVEVLLALLKKPLPLLLGMTGQFLIMPLYAFTISHLASLPKPLALALIITCSAPSGGGGYLYSLLLGGDVTLAISLTLISTVAACGAMPISSALYGWLLGVHSALHIPFLKILGTLLFIAIPVSLGVLVKLRLPTLSTVLLALVRPVSLALMVGGVVVAFQMGSTILAGVRVSVAAVGASVPVFGLLVGLALARVVGLASPQSRTLGIEVGVQNSLLALAVLQISFPRAQADFASQAPFIVALSSTSEMLLLVLAYVAHPRLCPPSSAQSPS